ncbi:MCP four helix bundle domain-containing protein, partial [Thiomicrorhabdus sp. ZW0627]|uniref:MCP four helix bundle domain-containing protein n=1 Tax=Thiomicrorhabdus sp. ZW0627 TaxID=3039774 RepID=UPI0024362F4E
MTIRTKLILSFALMLVLTAILGGAALWETKRLSASQDLVVNDRLPKLIAVERIIIFETRIQQNIREYLIQTDAAERQKLLDRIAEYRKENADLRNYLKESITSEQGKKLLADLVAANVNLVEANNMIMQSVQNGDLESAAKAVVAPENRERRLAQRKALRELVDYQKKLAQDSGAEGLKIAGQTQWVVGVILVASLALGIFLVLYILRSV